MDITKLGKPLRRLTLAFAVIFAILPAIFLVLFGFAVLTGGDTSIGPKELFVVSVSGGLSVFFIAMYIFIRKTRLTGIIVAIIIYIIFGTYIGYEYYKSIIPRI